MESTAPMLLGVETSWHFCLSHVQQGLESDGQHMSQYFLDGLLHWQK